MAHLSDALSQSIYSDSIDPTLPSDPFFFEPSEPTESQPTESQQTEHTPQLLPISIQRTRDQQWALWTEMTKADFIEWWLTTQYGMAKPDQIHWDKKGLKSNIWPYFDQIAHIETGKPKVICKGCNLIFSHPTIHGTKALKRHHEQGRCHKAQGRQGNIRQSLQNQVCLLEREK
jgi:hypothetical protein